MKSDDCISPRDVHRLTGIGACSRSTRRMARSMTIHHARRWAAEQSIEVRPQPDRDRYVCKGSRNDQPLRHVPHRPRLLGRVLFYRGRPLIRPAHRLLSARPEPAAAAASVRDQHRSGKPERLQCCQAQQWWCGSGLRLVRVQGRRAWRATSRPQPAGTAIDAPGTANSLRQNPASGRDQISIKTPNGGKACVPF